jgi:spermidine synthase
VAVWYDEVFQETLRTGLKVRKTVHSEQSDFQRIEILDTEIFGRTLVLDGIFQTSEGDEHFYHEMLVQPAMVTAPSIRRVLVIGGGDGGTAREVLRHREVEQLVMVEIDCRVVEACKEHLPSIGTAWNDPRLDLRFVDAVAYVAEAEKQSFDVILLDGSDPVGPAEGLFNEQFYRNCARILSPNGVFALQSETPVLFREVFFEIQRILGGIFERVHPYIGSVPLYGSGMWTWTYASQAADPMAIDDDRADRIEPHMKYYNRDIHRGAFALPNDIRMELSRD